MPEVPTPPEQPSGPAAPPAAPVTPPWAAPPPPLPAPLLPSRRAVRAAPGAPPPAPPRRRSGVARGIGVVLLLGAVTAVVLVSAMTTPARPAAPVAGPTSRPPAPTAPAPSASRTRPTATPADGGTSSASSATHVTLTLTSRPRSRTDQVFPVVGRHTGDLVLDDPARDDGDAARRTAAFDVGKGGFVVAWKPLAGWRLESLTCTTTGGNLATGVGATVVVATLGRGDVTCVAVVAKA